MCWRQKLLPTQSFEKGPSPGELPPPPVACYFKHMHQHQPFVVLWDASPLWGPLLARGLQSLGASFRLVRGADIPAVLGPEVPAVLVPGGSARRKAAALGPKGMAAVREYVAGGGNYLGLCGGAGLGLDTGDGSLGLCPWNRAPMTDKLKHFLSGHIHVAVSGAAKRSGLVPPDLNPWPSLPVWWPGRFAPCPSPWVEPLATYGEPAPDFMVADLAVRDLPPEILADWRTLYGVDVWPSFLAGEPCLLAANHGRGRVVLSYAHLETPDSPDANRWLAHLLAVFLGSDKADGPSIIPPWDLRTPKPLWRDDVLLEARQAMDDLVRLGQEHFLLYWREPWLLGWRRGLPGAALSSLLTLVSQGLSREPAEQAAAYWAAHRDGFAAAMEVFLRGARGYLLAERLAMTLRDDSVTGLNEQKLALFGPPPGFGGLLGELLPVLSELNRLLLDPEGGE